MSNVQIEQESYEMPPRDGFTVTHFITVADIDRSVRFLRKGVRWSHPEQRRYQGCVWIHSDREYVASCQRRGRADPDKPSVTLSVLADPDKISSFMNIRVADIQACYKLWKSRGAEFITEPIPKYGEIRCYIRDPDGYIIEVGQSKPVP